MLLGARRRALRSLSSSMTHSSGALSSRLVVSASCVDMNAVEKNLLPGQKLVHFVRHGEGEHNKEYDRMVAAGECEASDEVAYEDERFQDAQLTSDGCAQALALVDKVTALNPELVVSSAMARTIDTAVKACAGIHAPFFVTDDIKEGMTYGLHPCNVRRTRTELQHQFSGVDFSHLPEHDPHWWPQLSGETNGQLHARIRLFLEWLVRRPEGHIIVFTHCVVLFELLNSVVTCGPGCNADWFERGELRSFVLEFGDAAEPGRVAQGREEARL